jgi:hypothetical protein
MSIVVAPIDKSLAVLNYTMRNVANMRISSKQVQRLLDKCMETAEDLQQIDAYLLRSHRAHRLINTLVECLQWCYTYQKKYATKRFLCSAGYREHFQRLHRQLTEDFVGFTQSIQLTQPLAEYQKIHPEVPVPDLLTFDVEGAPPLPASSTSSALIDLDG